MSRDADLARGEPAELLIAQIRIGQATQHLAGARAAQYEHAASLGGVLDPHLLLRLQTLRQQVGVA